MVWVMLGLCTAALLVATCMAELRAADTLAMAMMWVAGQGLGLELMYEAMDTM